MKSESTISKINKELISVFAMLDTWFDEVLDNDNHRNAIQIADHILNSNHHLLRLVSHGFEDALSDSRYVRGNDDVHHSVDELRTTLRDQLHFCLYLLDEIETQNLSEEQQADEKEMDIYHQLTSMTNHVSYHLEELKHQT
jgi:hypothetical protein